MKDITERTKIIIKLKHKGLTWRQIADSLGLNRDTVRKIYYEAGFSYKNIISESPYPAYDSPLETTTESAIIFSDMEFPFHASDFINRCLDLAQRWNVKHCIVAGDVLHFDTLSAWGAEFDIQPSMTAEQRSKVENLLAMIPNSKKTAAMEIMAEFEGSSDSYSTEMNICRNELRKLGECFDNIDFVLGNHEKRFLAAVNSKMFANELLIQLQLAEGKWRIAPYYYSILNSGNKTWRIEHPNGTAQRAAVKLASKYLCNITMGHSHAVSMNFDASGKFWAIQQGHCCDERLMPYAAQRSNTRDAHVLAALIIRDGRPHLLYNDMDWGFMQRFN